MSPCMDCPKRRLRCHASCEAYARWSAIDRDLREKAKRPLVAYNEERRYKIARYKRNRRG